MLNFLFIAIFFFSKIEIKSNVGNVLWVYKFSNEYDFFLYVECIFVTAFCYTEVRRRRN